MTPTRQPTHAASDAPPSPPRSAGSALHDPMSMLADLRGLLRAQRPPAAAAQGTPDLLLPAFEQLVSEHRGLADELLHVYEQLGMVFDVTSKLSTTPPADESAVLALFGDTLRRSFAGREVLVARPGKDQSWSCPGTWLSRERCLLHGFLGQALESVCRGPRRRTAVVRLGEAGASGAAQALIGPVYSGEELVCAMVIVRPDADPSACGPEFHASDMSLVESLATFCGDVIRNHRLLRQMREMSIAMVRALVSAVDQKDEYTCGHSLRVGYYATTLGRLLHLPENQLQMLQWAALLHDVGKIGIRDSVLNKHGKLTPEEFEHIKEHPVRSHRVVQEVSQLAGALDGILHHHERYDGSGYPAGLKGQDIPLQARIIQIADIFDALTSTRSYRPAYDWQKALTILQEEAGKSTDPELQKLFDRHIRQSMAEGPDAWARMIEKANHFASAFGGDDLTGGAISLPILPSGGNP